MHFIAAAVITPSGPPPIPISMSTPVSSKQVAIPAAISPASNILILHPNFLATSNI